MEHQESWNMAQRLEAYWARSCPAGADSAQAFAQLLAAWSEPQRAYHTPQHLLETLTLLDDWCGTQDWPADIALALFFHDAVYDPRRADNEALSARMAEQMLARLQVDEARVRAIVRLIDITRHAAVPRAEDEKLVVDLDLAILGAAPERYAQYRRQVREEYAHVPEALFLRGRLAVLQRFLQAGAALFHTARGRSAFAAAARRNLGAEVAELQAAIGTALD